MIQARSGSQGLWERDKGEIHMGAYQKESCPQPHQHYSKHGPETSQASEPALGKLCQRSQPLLISLPVLIMPANPSNCDWQPLLPREGLWLFQWVSHES